MSYLLALAAALPCAGCPTDTGNPFTTEARLHAHSSEPTRVGVDLAAVDGNVKEVWLGIGAVRYYGGCSREVGAATPPIVDLAGPTPQVVTAPLTSSSLCRLGVDLHTVTGPELPPGAPTELIGASILVGGLRADDVPFIIRSTVVGEVDLRGIDGNVELDDLQPTFLGFDAAAWITPALDLDGAIPTAGIITIEAATDPTRLAAFDAVLAGGFELYDDPDASGSADAGEAKLAKGEAIEP